MAVVVSEERGEVEKFTKWDPDITPHRRLIKNGIDLPYDPFLVAAKIADDAVLAYHTALEYHGKAYTAYHRTVYASDSRSHTAWFRGHEYVRVSESGAIRASGKTMFGVESYHRDGVTVRVTNLDRTFVDVLDRPETSGSREEMP